MFGACSGFDIRLLEPGAYSLNVGGLVAVSWHLAVGKLIYIYTYICIIVIGMYACMHVCMYVYMYVYVYAYVYVYVYNVVKTCN